ncbi:LytR C-terminal domain-containing protein [Streptomyces sp. MUM 203J]|nr:LytR C-terminal domain-containing protein [Streptomyces sp. MUM 203J]
MGGQYRITGKTYPRMRRPRRRGRITLAVVAATAALGLAGWGTVQLIDVFGGGSGDSAKRATAGATCQAPSPSAAPATALPKPGDITVNVYNATPRAGLAKTTADELEKRGFTIGKVANAPETYDKKVTGPGILLGAPAAAKGAFSVLGTHLQGADSKTDTRETGDVDLIIGSGFKALARPAEATAAMTALLHPKPEPSVCATPAKAPGKK